MLGFKPPFDAEIMGNRMGWKWDSQNSLDREDFHFPLEKSMGRLGKRGSWSSLGPEMGHLHPLRKVKWWQAIGYGYPIPKALRRCYLQQAWYIAILHGVPMFQNPWNLALHNLSWHQRQHLEFSCVPMFQMSPPRASQICARYMMIHHLCSND